MSPESLKIVNFHLQAYRRQGASPYRRRQYRRLLAIINNVLEHEPDCHNDLNRIGRRQIIGYWCRHEHEVQRVRIEKYRIVALLWDAMSKPAPPKPRIIKPDHINPVDND